MKKRARILCLLVAAIVVFAMFPIQASTATNYNKVFNNLKITEVKNYNDPLPTAGEKKQTAKQIRTALAKFGNKVPGTGPVYIKRELTFSAYKKDIYSIKKHSYWSTSSGDTTKLYYERKDMAPVDRVIACEFQDIKGRTSDTYRWDLGAKCGTNLTQKLPKEAAPKMTNCKKYNNVTVLGQKCYVYSYIEKGQKDTTYVFVSRKTGLTIKTIVAEASRPVTYTTITFVEKYGTKADRFFDKPAGVTFSKK